MRPVPLEQARPGMVLAADVAVGDRVLLRAGSSLTPWHLRRLEEVGVQTLYVREGGQATETQPQVQFRQRVLQHFRPGRHQAIVLAVGEEVLGSPGVSALLKHLRGADGALFDHSLAVCATTIVLASRVGLSMPELRPLALGAALHDVGKLVLPKPLWVKPGRLTEEEYRAIQRHTEAGYRLIQRAGLDPRSALVAYQHHERWDGTGYPRGIARERIHPFARIVGLVDVFEALRADRPYRPAWPFAEAVQYVQAQASHAFDPYFARAFLAYILEHRPPEVKVDDAAGTARTAR